MEDGTEPVRRQGPCFGVATTTQRDVFDRANNLAPARCGHCRKSEMEFPPEVGLKRCSGCGLVVYCGKECQQMAWPTHKLVCKLHTKNRLGAGVHGSKNTEDQSHNLRSDNSNTEVDIYPKTCGGCFKTEKSLGMPLKNCQACRMEQYCGYECQKRDWSYHKFSCQINSFTIQQIKEAHYPAMHEDLAEFADTFRHELENAGRDCLRLQTDPEAWKTHAFVIRLRYVPWRPRAAHRFDVRCCKGLKISDFKDSEVAHLLKPPEDARLKHFIKLSKQFNKPLPQILRVVMMTDPDPDNAKQQGLCVVQHHWLHPAFGPWSPNWERDFVDSIQRVQVEAQKSTSSPKE